MGPTAPAQIVSQHESVVGDIEAFLQQAITDLQPDLEESRRLGRGRPRILPSLCLWAGMLVCVLRGFSNQTALWRLLSHTGLWFYPRFPVTDEAIYKRLAKEGTAPVERLFAHITQVLASRLTPYAIPRLAPFATSVLALDQTTLDKVARTLPHLRPLPDDAAALLPGKLAGLFDIRLQQWRQVRYIENPLQNEKADARDMLQSLDPGALILCDLGYFGFAWFDYLTDAGHYYVSRLRAKTSFQCLHTFYQEGDCFDGLVFLGAYRADRAQYAVRLVRFQVGTTTFSYITNVLDPSLLPIVDIARLYTYRWDIELAFKLIKRELGLHLLWSAKPVVIQQQLWAVLIISQVLQGLRLEIAGRAAVDVYDVSLPLLVQWVPQLAYTGADPVAFFVERGRSAGFIRPSRRTRAQAPTIPPSIIAPIPDGLVLSRAPRYANRNCGPRASKSI
ncbi:MAG: IS4 family transposase [Anaerolineae bacterium]|nr:IS4 family transposase [Anaerolineae bacterium]